MNRPWLWTQFPLSLSAVWSFGRNRPYLLIRVVRNPVVTATTRPWLKSNDLCNTDKPCCMLSLPRSNVSDQYSPHKKVTVRYRLFPGFAANLKRYEGKKKKITKAKPAATADEGRGFLWYCFLLLLSLSLSLSLSPSSSSSSSFSSCIFFF